MNLIFRVMSVLIMSLIIISIVVQKTFITNIKACYDISLKTNITIAIDFTHFEYADDATSTNGYGLGGFSKICMVKGYNILKQREYFGDFLMWNAKILLLNAPAKHFSEKDISALVNYINNGGIVLYTTNSVHPITTNSFLANFGLSLDKELVGPALVSYDSTTGKYNKYIEESESLLYNETGINIQNIVKLYNSSSFIIKEGNDVNILIKYNNSIVIAEKFIGSGKLIFIADDFFLTSQNLLEMGFGNPKIYKGNIEFIIKHLL